MDELEKLKEEMSERLAAMRTELEDSANRAHVAAYRAWQAREAAKVEKPIVVPSDEQMEQHAQREEEAKRVKAAKEAAIKRSRWGLA